MQNNSKYYSITVGNYLIKILLQPMHIDEENLHTFLQKTSQNARYVLVWNLR